MAVAGSDGLKARGLQSSDCRQLGLRAAHSVAGDLTVITHLESVAEQSRIAELLHERHRELSKGVTDDDDLGDFSQLIKKFLSSRQRIDLLDRSLDFPKTEPMLFQYAESPLHELVIVRLIAGRAAKFGDSAGLRKRDPDLRNQYTFHIKADNIKITHILLSFRFIRASDTLTGYSFSFIQVLPVVPVSLAQSQKSRL